MTSSTTSSIFDTITHTLAHGGIAVVRTDTVYGIIALASNEYAVQKVYNAKDRDPTKQCILLVASAPEDSEYGDLVEKYSGRAKSPTSVVVPSTNEPEWLLKGGDTIAYRVVRDPFLKSVIEAVGPVIAPSANPEGFPPARTITEAQSYFKDDVDCYINGGEVPETIHASEIIKINEDETVEVIRASDKTITNLVEKPIHRSSGGVLIHDGKVLLIHWEPPRDSYDFPKGTIEAGESSEDACIREVSEETGYKTEIIAFIGSNEFDFQTSEGEWRHKISDYYLLELTDETPYEAQREEHETFENVWVELDEATNIITRDINKDIFEKALLLRESL